MNYKFSIITPEHKKSNIPYLLELYQSIKMQTYSNWEWVIYVNGDCKIGNIPTEIKEDPQVKIYTGITHENVGFIKNKAFNLGKGDILVEVDHDDLITENCLEELNIAYQDQDIGFAYSNTLLYDMRNTRLPWNSEYGWTHTVHEFRGEKFYSMDSFPATSHSMGIIWYAPDHIRSWRKSVYQQVGGHNPDLNICDDQELMIRTYLVSKFAFIPKILYRYRFLPNQENTQLKRLDDIQKKTFELFYQYGLKLAERDTEFNNLLKVDISPESNRIPGYTSVGKGNADFQCDLNDGIPLPDNSAFIINANDILQKIKDPIKIMGEIYRVLVDGGWAFIQVPSTDGRGAFQDPTHISYWNENSFWYYTRKEKAKFIENSQIRFQEFRLDTVWWENNIAMTNAWVCAIKSDKKRPHPIYI